MSKLLEYLSGNSLLLLLDIALLPDIPVLPFFP
jgi:hypothetical protein